MATQEFSTVNRLRERNPRGGIILTLSDIANFYFPEGTYPPKDQMVPMLHLFNQMLSANHAPLYISAETYLPILGDKHSLQVLPTLTDEDDPDSPENRLRQQLVVPKVAMYVKSSVDLDRVAGGIISGLGVFENLSKYDFGYTVDDHVEIRRLKRSLKVKNGHIDPAEAVDKSSYIIYEEKESILGHRIHTLTLAVDSEVKHHSEHHPSPLRPLLSFEVKQNSVAGSIRFLDTPPSSRDMVINWDSQGMAEWLAEAEEPYANLSDTNLVVLANPITITTNDFTLLEKTCAGVFDHERQITRDQERKARPYYYLELMMAAAKMTYYASNIQDKNHAFFTDSQEHTILRKEFGERLNFLFGTEFGFSHDVSATRYYSPLEYLMYELLGRGEDIWQDQQEFTTLMTKAVEHPTTFWETVRLLGLDSILPAFRMMTDVDKAGLRWDLQINENQQMTPLESFCSAYENWPLALKRHSGESTLSYWMRIMSFLPDLSPYYKPRSMYELQQSDEYYMKICLAHAYSALEKGLEHVAALAVINGQIIAADHNQPTKYPGLYIHAEEIVLAQARQRCKPHDKITIFVSAEPCPGCADEIRKIPPVISRVVYGTRTATGGESVFGILSSPKLNNKVGPYGEPPEITFDVLGDESRQLLNCKPGWDLMTQ